MHGLRAILATNTSEYLATTTAAGLSVLVHDQGQFPFSDSLGYMIQPGAITTISITFRQMNKLSEPYGSCSGTLLPINQRIKSHPALDKKPEGYLYNMSYSTEACQRSIIQKNTMEACNCYDPNYPVPSNNTLAPCAIPDDGSSSSFLINLHVSVICWESIGKNIQGPDCYQPCNEAMYTISTSTARWPDSSTGFVAGCFEGMYNETCFKTYHENFSTLEIYYEKLNYESSK